MTDIKGEASNETMTSEELDRVSGGIIIVGGSVRAFALAHQSVLDRVALNPQPLPPKVFFGH